MAVNARVKWLWSANPQVSAIVAPESLSFFKRPVSFIRIDG